MAKILQACNWMGGEDVSVAVPFKDQAKFKAAGYTEVKTNSSYVGGVVRQHGSFSFTRVFQAGHSVSSFQPETGYEIFRRVTNNLDIATGSTLTISRENQPLYSSKGPANTLGWRHKLPPMSKSVCYLLSLLATCTKDQERALARGQARIENYIVLTK